MLTVPFVRSNANNLLIWDNTHSDFRSPDRGSYILRDSRPKRLSEIPESDYKQLLKASARKAVRRSIRNFYLLTLSEFFKENTTIDVMMHGVDQWVGSREDLVFFAESVARGNKIELPEGLIAKIRGVDAVFQEDLVFDGF